MPRRIPAVDYLRLDDPPSLEAHECARCGSLYFDRRNACAKCFATEFARRPLANEGVVKAFTIVHRAAPGVPAPYTSVIVALDGGGDVKANLLGVTDPSEIVAGLRVVLQTFVAGADDDGVEAVAFGYAPAGGAS
jgi:uncharacterized OB-fold protein